MRNLFLLFLVLIFSTNAMAQGRAVWNTLADVKYGSRFDKELEYDVEYPIFSEKIKGINGKEIEVKGYMIPLEELTGQNFFVLSAFPYNMCFFCGGAGPETVMEINTNTEISFSEKPILIKGRLELNESDYNHMMYILNDAVLLE
jgi:hypothetical protein